ncbi:GGDEF domain-containing protein [Mesorhizobium australicum]|uniref:diguanylate cyclase n=1 Tax=Mesorhizobium australicum TaxID=536018 RepID=A0A1X7NRR4_9HYPH|nr:GGDEF domain-containing protein [Mesorhizobium australicum]SMH40214.1 diguanylate cyclase (GGDEF) domain-containing protein [Mesorhizobium australicum]
MPTAASEPTHDDRSILSLQMDAIHSSSPASFLSIIAASLSVYVYWSPEIAAGLMIWFACIFAIAATNVITTAMRVRSIPSGWTDEAWERFVCVMHLLSGLAWGIGGGWMLSIATGQQALLTISIGLGAVTVSIPSVVHQTAYNLFHFPIFWCYAVGALFSSLEFGWVIAVGFFLLAPFSMLIGRDLGRRLVMALRLSIENKRLAERLEERTAALESANRELEVLSTTDPLTGVANRRRLMSFGRAAPASCAVLVVDIDHFKSYNDTYGHVEGDACLVAVADALRSSVRPHLDLVARLGGEEFVVVLTEATRDIAESVAERMRANVEGAHASGSKRIRRVVTASIGFSVRSPDRPRSFARLMEEADAAVYQAKAAGRNQVCKAINTRARRAHA